MVQLLQIRRYHSFRCSSYGNRSVNCTIHHISDKVLYQLVLRSIQRLSSHIIADERGFAEELKSKWEAQANGKPQKQKEELQTINRRLNELDRLIGSLYENFISGLLPEKQYKSLMKKYSAEQDSLESQVSEIQEKLEQTKASSAHIGRFIRLIKKYKQPAELTKEMACELIDKIVVHEAVGKSRTDSSRWTSTITSSDSLTSHFPKRKLSKQSGKPSEKRRKKPSTRKTGSVSAMLLIKPNPRRNAGRRMMGISTRSVSANSAVRSFIRTAQGRGFVTPTVRKPISKPKKKRNAMPKRAITPSVKRSARYSASPSGRPTVRRCCAPRNARQSTAGRNSLPTITVSNPSRVPEKQYNSRRTTQWRNSLQTKGQACVKLEEGQTHPCLY